MDFFNMEAEMRKERESREQEENRRYFWAKFEEYKKEMSEKQMLKDAKLAAEIQQQQKFVDEQMEQDMAIAISLTQHDAGASSPAYPNKRKELERLLRPYHLKLVDIPSDGNCQFRSIGYLLQSVKNAHQEFRSKAVDYMRRNRDCYAAYVHYDFDEYIRKMSADSTWGDHLTLQALSDVLHIHFIVLGIREVPPCTCELDVREILPMVEKPRLHLHLGFVNRHYDAVVEDQPNAGLYSELDSLPRSKAKF